MKRITILFFSTIIFFAFSCNNASETVSKKDSASAEIIPAIITNLQQKIKDHPDSLSLRMQLALAFDSIGDEKNALSQMDLLLKNDTSNYGYWFTEGQFFEHDKDTLHAIESYSRAAKIYASPDALLSIANLYAEQKNPRCLLICSNVRNLGLGKEYDAHCAFIAGVFNARTLQRDKAIQLFDGCIANDFTYMEAYIEKGLIFFDEKNYSKALEVFRFASTVDNLFPDSYYWMARCYEMMSVKDSAALRFRQALALDKTMTEAKEGLKRIESN